MKLKEYAENNNITQIALAKALGKTQAAISGYLAGKHIPGKKTMKKIRKFTGDLVTETDFYS